METRLFLTMDPTGIETPFTATPVRHHGRLFTVFAVFVALTILSIMGALMFEAVGVLQRILCPWSVGE